MGFVCVDCGGGVSAAVECEAVSGGCLSLILRSLRVRLSVSGNRFLRSLFRENVRVRFADH